jgi:pyridoxal 5'-phosphate synthase pdxT subunit
VLVGVLALQGDVAEHCSALGDLGVDSRPVRRAGDLTALDGLVVPGGESTTMSMLLDSSGLGEPVGEMLAAGLPVFGTCAGLILLSRDVTEGRPDQRTYGAIDICVRRNGYGRQLESFECDLDVPALGGRPFHAVFIRAPLVESVGPGVEVLAVLEGPGDPPAPDAGDFGCNAGGKERRDTGPVVSKVSPVVCRQGAVLVASFHPELTTDRRMHELFVSAIEGRPSSRPRAVTTVAERN